MQTRFPDAPARIAKLPVTEKGFPIPWFAATVNGVRDLRVVDPAQIMVAVKQRLCWICGEKLGIHVAFVIGPMCGINRTISEPPSHRECAEFAAKHCPFLSRPMAKRNDDGLEDATPGPGFAIQRNPGACGVWVTKSFYPFAPHFGQPGILFRFDDPVSLQWYANGRIAEEEEVRTSVRTGIPILIDIAKKEGIGARRQLFEQIKVFERSTEMDWSELYSDPAWS